MSWWQALIVVSWLASCALNFWGIYMLRSVGLRPSVTTMAWTATSVFAFFAYLYLYTR